ncbi:lytic transglycosylase domain-containing protein [uncultured Sneathiella sp.]|jgi:soluble lytic murein transglycosylase-like protein|uniref:lytic transglycosylase domain-containing protein n=1 Tax=uncultured Sneathiella sp. TaxID=879315 RepID=UPI0030DDDBBE|tara:strand:- start:50091 stop:51866 length:1776 start_codon:yes stop_codon:yes gene_type:complete
MKSIPRIIAALALLVYGLAWVPSPAVANTIPPVLSAADADRYRAIFALQDAGQWEKADKQIKTLTNNILIGHVKFQRYMHPTKYRASYEELHLWMKAYYDHPGAHRLYKLAKSRRLEGWKPLSEPLHGRYLGGTGPGQPVFLSRPYKSERKRSAQARNDVAHAKRVVSRYLYRGQPTNAAQYISQKKIRKLLDQVELDLLREKIAKSYFLYARDDKAIEFAEAALEKSRKNVPLADWTAGLAAWRLGKIEKAARHFAALAEASRISDWNFTAANWWASRAYLKLGEPEKAYHYLEQTASQPRTFYGLLALRQLGVEKPFSWDLPTLKPENIDWLMKIPSAKRAVALSEIGKFDLAAQELRAAFPSANEKLAPLLLALAEEIGAPSVAMRMGLYLWESENVTWDAAIYPMPKWQPGDGFKVDRALLYAFMRQESGFYSLARSGAGAKGLMQIMPTTASYLSGDRSLRDRNNNKLFDPTYNLELGQKYLTYLMEYKDIETNLFHLTAAYNGGPGNLKKWKSETKYSEDPLFFIEAMPSKETRNFIKRVLTNFWIYRHRMGQDLPGLDQIASGGWPEYQSLDLNESEVADNARN